MSTKKSTPKKQAPVDSENFNARKTAAAIFRKLRQPKGRGAEYSLTEKKLRMLFKLLLQGNYREVACRGAGIVKATFYVYEKRGEEARQVFEETGKYPEGNSEVFAEILNAIEYCEANSEADIVVKASKESPIRFLQLRYRDRYHPKQPMGIDLENPNFAGSVHIYLPSNGREPDKTETAPSDKPKGQKP
jgi:hypothetical protein